MADVIWSKPYHGVTHGNVQGKKSYATVTDHGSFADLALWFYGCGLRPIKQQHEDAEAAKTAAETWLADSSRV